MTLVSRNRIYGNNRKTTIKDLGEKEKSIEIIIHY